MSSVNRVTILGRVGKDPELRYATGGAAICNLSVATSRSWKDKTSGERQEETEWHRVALFERLAEVAGEYVKKGKQVYIEGRLKTRKWTDKDGVERYTTEIMATELVLLGSGEDKGAAPAPAQRSAPVSRAPAPPSPRKAAAFDDMDDDIPF
jgi:single-strand DNA-binding protein